MPTSEERELSQSDRRRQRALAQKWRAARAARHETVFELVVAGYRRELIPQKSGVSLATVRREVDRAIDQRRLDAPDRYPRLQVTRLTTSLRVVDDALELCDLKAVESLVKILGMLDRYHGLAAAGATNGRAAEPRRLSRVVAPLALTHAAPGLELSPAEVQKADEGKFSCLQSTELSHNRKIISLRHRREDASRRKLTMTESASPKALSSRLIVELLNPGVSVAAIAAREDVTARGVARKWRRNGLIRLNPRPEMVWAPKPRCHKIWYTRAPDPRKVAADERANDKAERLQKKAPNVLKSLDAKQKSASVPERGESLCPSREKRGPQSPYPAFEISITQWT